MSSQTWVSIGGCDIAVISKEDQNKVMWDLQAITWEEGNWWDGRGNQLDETWAKGQLTIKEVFDDIDRPVEIAIYYINEDCETKGIRFHDVLIDYTPKGQVWSFRANTMSKGHWNNEWIWEDYNVGIHSSN
jgi:hypothetical protein